MIRPIWALAKTLTLAYFRNKVALFFTFLFPLIFLIVFGFLFGSDLPSINLGLVSQSQTSAANQLEEALLANEVFKIDQEKNFEDLKLKLGRSQIDGILFLPADFGQIKDDGSPSGDLQIIYNESDEELFGALSIVLDSLLREIDPSTQEPNFKTVGRPLKTLNLSAFDYVFPGILGFCILTLGIFSMSEGFIQDKKSKALLRIRLAPIKTWQFIAAVIANRVFIGLCALTVVFLVSLLVFDFQLRGNPFSLFLFSIISLICLLGFGIAIAGWARNQNQASPISNLISFPMMFLSGVFFPVFLMPLWLQNVTAFIPLTAVVDGLRLIAAENKSLLELGPQLLIIAIWTALMYLIAARTFRWE